MEQAGTVSQSHTAANWLHVRAAMRWSLELDSYVRYRLGFADDPLFGVAKNGVTNSALPTQAHLVEIGSTWSPVDNFLVSATVGIDNRWSTSQVANFQEDNFPIVLTRWYAPTPRWSLSGGLALFSN